MQILVRVSSGRSHIIYFSIDRLHRSYKTRRCASVWYFTSLMHLCKHCVHKNTVQTTVLYVDVVNGNSTTVKVSGQSKLVSNVT